MYIYYNIYLYVFLNDVPFMLAVSMYIVYTIYTRVYFLPSYNTAVYLSFL